MTTPATPTLHAELVELETQLFALFESAIGGAATPPTGDAGSGTSAITAPPIPAAQPVPAGEYEFRDLDSSRSS